MILLEGGEDEYVNGEGEINLPKGDNVGSCSLIGSSAIKPIKAYPG